ncbi:DUF3575 domain-containing protein [Flavobacterium aquicola]|uniref:Uncharacterized protein DUF3575 n=1 Tax=Flavobacterium aquicola TaxID=1682742 RepID=A0A3E0E413_9FLAO|nr:DUF3575 domain-containing protein [Flavobacterium aquicola]REG92988.1 uncharacterized protein DUF3575 [Flavobacterium aquicola]
MKKIIVLGFVLISFIAKAQEAEKVSVEKNLYGAQLGLLSTSFYYETQLQRKISLRTEIGLTLVTSTRDYIDPEIKDETATLITPYLTLEPRWYYSLDRRKRLGKKTYNNSSNYISLATSYISNKTPLINNGDFDVVSAITIIPKYGMRRAFAKHFNYEFSGGVGYQYNIFSKNDGCNCDHNTTTVDLQIRIGYDF